MSKIFISYRREDSISHVGRLYDHLVGRFGEEKIFMDIDNMMVGLDQSEKQLEVFLTNISLFHLLK